MNTSSLLSVIFSPLLLELLLSSLSLLLHLSLSWTLDGSLVWWLALVASLWRSLSLDSVTRGKISSEDSQQVWLWLFCHQVSFSSLSPLLSSFFPSISLVWQSALMVSSLIYPGRIQRGILSWWNRLDPVLTVKCTRWGWEEEESRGVLIVVRMECVCTFMSLHCVTYIHVQLVCMFYFDLLFN